MVFLSAAQRAKYVVSGYPRRKVTDLGTGAINTYPGLEARFLNHRFDSVTTQRDKGWTDEQRKLVENYLLAHRDFDAPRGIHLEIVDGETKEQLMAAAGHVSTPEKIDGRNRCAAWIRNEHGESEMCPKPAIHGELCAQHAGLLGDEQDEEGEVPAPVEAALPGHAQPGRRFTMKVG